MKQVIEIRHYVDRAGEDIFQRWLAEIRDGRTKAKIGVRVGRFAMGNFGDCRPLREGVWELRIDWGPGYRVYYSLIGKAVALLLCAGDKQRQSSDIDRAIGYLKGYRERAEKS
jgi:putative addiction module killer protein